MKKEYIIISVLIFIILILGGLTVYWQDEAKSKQGIIDVKDRSIEVYRNDLGQAINKVQTSLIQIEDLKELNVKKDSNLKRVKDLYEQEQSINKRLNSIIVFNNSIIAKYSDSISNIISSIDTVNDNGNIYLYPLYDRKLDMFDNWIVGSLSIGKNKFNIDISINSKYDIHTYRKRDNLFSKYKLYTELKLYNPYETTTDFISVTDDNKRNRFNVSVFTGVVITNKIQFGVGLGVGYTLFTF